MPLNPIEEAKFAELKDKCRELKVPAPPEIFIGLQVHDRSGVLVFDDKQRGHSWTRNFYNFMAGITMDLVGSGAFGAGYMSGKGLNGTTYQNTGLVPSRAVTAIGNGYLNNATDAAFGILVGTGDTAFNVGQNTLATLIAHGTSSGQLAYIAMTVGTQAYSNKIWTKTISRLFNNNSAGAITVKETGLANYGGLFGASYFLFERSVLDPTVAVANGAQLTVTYEISMDFSAID